jgi:hypothetical protein
MKIYAPCSLSSHAAKQCHAKPRRSKNTALAGFRTQHNMPRTLLLYLLEIDNFLV